MGRLQFVGGRDGQLGRDHQLAGQLGIVGFGEREADHVGRPVVTEMLAIDSMDRRVVDQRDRDRGTRDPLARKHAANQAGELRRIDVRNAWVSLISTSIPIEFSSFFCAGSRIGLPVEVVSGLAWTWALARGRLTRSVVRDT